MTKFSHLILALVLITGGFIFQSCEEEENQPAGAPTADAGEDQEVGVNSTVTLDASGSSDPDSTALTFEWSIVSKPDTSSLTLDNPSSPTFSITLDAEGEYVFEVTVTDSAGFEDTDQVTYTVSSDVETVATIELSGSITQDSTLTDIFQNSETADYRVTGDLSAEAELTIEPGVKIEFEEDNFLTVTPDGVIKAAGSENDSIIFTSANVAGNIKWGGILIESGNIQNEMSYTKVLHAGRSRSFYGNSSWRTANLSITGDGKLNLTHSLIANSAAEGVYSAGDNFESFESNTFKNNENHALSIHFNQAGMIDSETSVDNDDEEDNYIRIYGSTMSDDQEIIAFDNGNYRVTGDITLSSELTINEGARMEFEEDVHFNVGQDGVLMSQGTSNEPVVLTSANIDGGIHWAGIFINSGNINNELDNTEISYAGSDRLEYINGSWRNANIAITETGKVKLTNSVISNSSSEGIYTYGTTFEAFENNQFSDNESYPISIHFDEIGKMDNASTFSGNDSDVVRVYGSSMENSQTITKLDGETPYNFTGEVTVNADLEIDAGAQLTFDEAVQFNVSTDGSLNAVGTSSEQIVFTSSNIAGGIHWNGILIQSANALNQLEYVEISYGGNERLEYWDGDWRHANLGIAGGSIEVNNCEITNSAGVGIIVSSASTLNNLSVDDTNPGDDIENSNSISSNSEGTVLFTN